MPIHALKSSSNQSFECFLIFLTPDLDQDYLRSIFKMQMKKLFLKESKKLQNLNSDWHISTSRDPSKKKYDHKSLLVGLYHDKKSWFRPKIMKLILARSQNHAFSNHAFSTLLRFQNNMLVRDLAITMHFLGVNGFLWIKSTSQDGP